MHPSRRILGRKSDLLRGRRVAFGVTGSIAAVEAVRIAHELIRHGAEVIPIMTKAAADLVTPLALEYATGVPPILKLTGKGEHVALCGGPPGGADVLLIAPATANTIAKVALGVDDTVVTTCATVALGAKVPVVVAPAMHEVMGGNPAVKARLSDLERMGVLLVEPRREEEKAKVASAETIVDTVIHAIARGPLVGKRVLVVSGSTAEPIDPVRVLTNRSSGRMGVELATAAYHAGAHVDLWNAWGLVPLPGFAGVKRFETVADLARLVEKNDLSRYDVIFVPAALSDYAARPAKEKISSASPKLTITLDAQPKILPRMRAKAPRAFLVGFKAESDASKLLTQARRRLKEHHADLFVANTSKAFSADRVEAWLVGLNGKPAKLSGSKAEVARRIVEAASRPPRKRR